MQASSEQIIPRKASMDLLAAAPEQLLLELWDRWQPKPAVSLLRGPEAGLVMVRGRAGGGGAPFNLGEASVMRASVRLDSGEVGHAYCLGRSAEKARIAAIFDALWQTSARPAVEERVLAPIAATLSARDQRRAAETAATRVDFFTLVRGED